jgi:NAD-dependent dihydropyrimidine dehydrogenase PreA subunit
MTETKAYAFPNRNTPSDPVIIDPALCNGCNMCVHVCLADLFIPNQDKGKPPIILYPEECWYEGSCVTHCPKIIPSPSGFDGSAKKPTNISEYNCTLKILISGR